MAFDSIGKAFKSVMAHNIVADVFQIATKSVIGVTCVNRCTPLGAMEDLA